jgi:tetrachlorobenzoquinone reductase
MPRGAKEFKLSMDACSTPVSATTDRAAGTLDARLTAIRYAAEGIHLYEFSAPDGGPLPPFTAGAHVDLHLPNGLVRQYSLCNAPHERHRYVVGIKRDAASRGGSSYVHEQLKVGTVLPLSAPRNHFALHEEAAHTVLVAGGIGVTPIACMAQRLRELGASFEVHYGVRRREEAAFLDVLQGPGFHLHVDTEHGNAPLAVAEIVARAPQGAHLYCCGPAPMLDAFEAAAKGRPADLVHLERFSAAAPVAAEGGFTVQLARSKRSIFVAKGCTILDTLRQQGVAVQASCEQGICGSCETRVISGRPDHRDALLSEQEKAANDVMMVCCSGSKDPVLVLDL